MKTLTRRLFQGAMCLPVAVAAMWSTAAVADSLKGKEVTLLVGYGPSSGITSKAQALSRHLARHVPGAPKFIVKNMSGAGTLKAHNYVAQKARKDGTMLYFGPSPVNAKILGSKGFRFEYDELTMLGLGASAGRVMFMRSDSVPGGAGKPADIVKATRLVYAGNNPVSNFDLFGRMALDLLGIKYRYVTGYRGGGKVLAALLRNEANISIQNTGAWKLSIQPQKEILGLWHFPLKGAHGVFVDNPLIKDLPTYQEVYRQIHGKPPSGRAWEALDLIMTNGTISKWFFGPPGMDKQAARDLSRGFYATLADKDYIADATKTTNEPDYPLPLSMANDTIARLRNLDPSMVQYLKDFIASSRRRK